MTARRAFLGVFIRDRSGATIVEFALIFPVFLLAVVGGLYMGMLGFSAASLQSAARSGARCYALNLAACSTATKAQAYARSKFVSVTADQPVFTAVSAACGRQMQGTLDFTFNAGMFKMNVPLTSQACFPQ